jgi:hypothetical protein
MARAGQELALTSLAAMANALGRSDTLSRSLEIAAEEARRVLHAGERVSQPAGSWHRHRADHHQRG